MKCSQAEKFEKSVIFKMIVKIELRPYWLQSQQYITPIIVILAVYAKYIWVRHNWESRLIFLLTQAVALAGSNASKDGIKPASDFINKNH